MTDQEEIVKIIFSVVDETNWLLPSDRQLTKSTETHLFGDSSNLDSLGLVTFITETEEKIEEELGVSITLADERAMSQKNSPFGTVGTLADYICLLLKKKSNS
jgi:acyl carrier protein